MQIVELPGRQESDCSFNAEHNKTGRDHSLVILLWGKSTSTDEVMMKFQMCRLYKNMVGFVGLRLIVSC